MSIVKLIHTNRIDLMIAAVPTLYIESLAG